MFHPIPLSAQVAQHDAWLEEMRKEPLQGIGRPARLRVHGRLLSRVGRWLVSAGLHLQVRYRQGGDPAPEVTIQTSKASV